MKMKIAVFQHEGGGMTVEIIPVGKEDASIGRCPEFTRLSQNMEIEFEMTGEPVRPDVLGWYGEVAA